MDGAFDKELVVRIPHQKIVAGAFASAILFASVMFAAIRSRLGMDLAQLGFLVVAAIGGFARMRPDTKLRRVHALPTGLKIGDRVISRAAIKSSLVRHEGAKTYARFECGVFDRIDVEVESEAEANRLLEALRLDAKSATTELPVFLRTRLGGLAAIPFVLFGLLWGMTGGAGPGHGSTLGLIPLVMVVALLGVARLMRTSLLVGADGVRAKTLLGKGKFYAHDDIAMIENDGVRIDLRLKNGRTVSYDAARTKSPKEEDIEVARSIVRRIEAARRANAELGSIDDRASVLARGDRTVEEWVSALKRLGEGADATFRTIAVPREALLHVLESTRAKAVARIAAAIALRGKITPEEAPRVRVAIERCAEPDLERRLRVALEAPDDDLAVGALTEAEVEAQSVAESARESRAHSAKS